MTTAATPATPVATPGNDPEHVPGWYPLSIAGPILADHANIELTSGPKSLMAPTVCHFSLVAKTGTYDATNPENRFTANRTLHYVWDFGDPSGEYNILLSGWNVAHCFDKPGNYLVTCTISDDAGNAIKLTLGVDIVPDTRKQVHVNNVTALAAALAIGGSHIYIAAGSYVWPMGSYPNGLHLPNDIVCEAEPGAIVDFHMPLAANLGNNGAAFFYDENATQRVMFRNLNVTGEGHIYQAVLHGDTWWGWIKGTNNSLINVTFDKVGDGIKAYYTGYYHFFSGCRQMHEWSTQRGFMWIEGHHTVEINNHGLGSFWENVRRTADNGTRRSLIYGCTMEMAGYPSPFLNKTTFTLRNNVDTCVAYCTSVSRTLAAGNWLELAPKGYIEECRNTLIEHCYFIGHFQLWFKPPTHGVECRNNVVYIPWSSGPLQSIVIKATIPVGTDPSNGLVTKVPGEQDVDGINSHDNVLYATSSHDMVSFWGEAVPERGYPTSVYNMLNDKLIVTPKLTGMPAATAKPVDGTTTIPATANPPVPAPPCALPDPFPKTAPVPAVTPVVVPPVVVSPVVPPAPPIIPPPVVPPKPPVVPPVVSTAAATPFQSAFQAGASIPAWQFDKGGPGVAYHQKSPTNQGDDPIRDPDTVSIQSPGHTVGHTATGDWMQYTVNLRTSGKYAVQAWLAQVQVGAQVHFEFWQNGKAVVATTPVNVPNSGDWDKPTMVEAAAVTLPAGIYGFRIVCDKSAANGAVGNMDFYKIMPR